jgi:serine beta-lactamase-like protein LACTB, mitochondrial
MTRNRIQNGLVLLGLAAAALVSFVVALYVYVVATTRPLHPDVQSVPSVSRAAPQAKWTEAVERSRDIMRAGLTEQNLPGLSVAVGLDGDIVWAEGFGYADLEKQATVTPETQFRIGDVSNTFTSAAVGLLLEKQRLNLDADVQVYVPEFPEKQWPVNLRQLMGNVAGVRTDAGDEESLEPCQRTLDGLKRFAEDPLRFEPGTRFRSSSYGWILVSAAVEAAAKEPFFTFMRTQIFDPLGMSATRPDSATEAIPDRATFYFPRFGGNNLYGPELAREGDHSCFAGAGAFLSTSSDLVRFGAATRHCGTPPDTTTSDLGRGNGLRSWLEGREHFTCRDVSPDGRPRDESRFHWHHRLPHDISRTADGCGGDLEHLVRRHEIDRVESRRGIRGSLMHTRHRCVTQSALDEAFDHLRPPMAWRDRLAAVCDLVRIGDRDDVLGLSDRHCSGSPGACVSARRITGAAAAASCVLDSRFERIGFD